MNGYEINVSSLSKSVNFITSVMNAHSFNVWVIPRVIQNVAEFHYFVPSHIHLEAEHAWSVSSQTLNWAKDVSVHHYALCHVRPIHHRQVLEMSSLFIDECIWSHLLCWMFFHVRVQCWCWRSIVQALWLAGPLRECLMFVVHGWNVENLVNVK